MAFWGTRVLEIVKKHDSGGLVWKRIKLTSTRKANAKKRLLRVWQITSSAFTIALTMFSAGFLVFSLWSIVFMTLTNEAVLRACSEAPPSKSEGLGVDARRTSEAKSSQVGGVNE